MLKRPRPGAASPGQLAARPVPAFVLGLDERLDALEQRVLREADDDLTEITVIGTRPWRCARS
jgi:hypothetical protein